MGSQNPVKLPPVLHESPHLEQVVGLTVGVFGGGTVVVVGGGAVVDEAGVILH